MFVRLLVVFLLWFLVATPPQAAPKEPLPDPELGSIGVTFISGMFRGQTAEEVFFARLDDDADGYRAPSIIKSNFTDRGQVYLLNAEPGRYVAVGAVMAGYDAGTWTGEIYIPGGGYYTFTVYFSEKVIAQTETTVQPGELAFMGKFVGKKVTQKPTKRPPDELQTHYFLLNSTCTKDHVHRIAGLRLKQADRDSATERAFWTKARNKVFQSETAWQELARNRLDGQATAGY